MESVKKIENNLFNDKKMEEFIQLYDDVLTVNADCDPISYWIKKLERDELRSEKTNYIKFFKIILENILGYEFTDIKYEENIGDEGRPVEFTLKKDDMDYVVVELKGTTYKDLNKRYNREQSPIEQVTNYASIKEDTQWAFVSNYNEFRLFNPSYREKYISFKFKQLTDPDVLKRFLLIFSKFSLIEKDIPQTLLKETKIIERDLEDEFYKLFNETRLMIIKELETLSDNIDHIEAIRLSQLILNRFIFLCFAEDLKLIPSETTADVLLTPIKHKNLMKYTMWNRLNELFIFADEGNIERGIGSFNGGLFKEDLYGLKIRDKVEDLSFFEDCYKKWKFEEKYDDIKEQLGVYKDILNPIYKNLLVISTFDFGSELSVNILGHIFENSIGDIEELKDETTKRRKKEGVFYTPEYITDYLCRNTIIPYLSITGEAYTVHELIKEYEETDSLDDLDKKLKEIKIVDPACGSGACLNKAVDVLFEIHKALYDSKYSDDKLDKYVFDSIDSRRQIIINNIYGVDLNEESVEITKLSLFLKLATSIGVREGFKLPNLNKNIKCGNSLCDDDTIVGNKSFDWKEEFNEVFDNGGFDIVIGNPPYVSSQIKNLSEDEEQSEKKYLKENYITAYKSYDLYVLFIEKGITILKENGIISYINPNKFLNSAYGEKLKEYLNNYHVDELIDFGDNQIFKDAKNYTCILKITKTTSNKPTFYLKNITNPELTLLNFNNKQENEYSKLIIISNEQMKKWNLVDKHELDILNKLKQYDTLSKFSTNIWEGARPGFEKAYIVNEDEIFDLNLERPLIKKFIKNEDINQYSINLKGEFNNPKFIIFPYVNSELVNLNDYPNIKSHLERFNNELYDSNGKDNDELRYSYYHLPKEFNDNTLMIITPDISKHNSFTLLESDDIIFPNTIYSISINREFNNYKNVFLAILNSNLIEWFIKKISPSIRGGYYRYKSTYLEQIPILPLNMELHNKLNELTVNLIGITNEKQKIKNSFIAFLERELEIDLSLLKRKSYIPNCFNYPFSGRKESIFNIIQYNKNIIEVNYHSKDFQDNLEREFENCQNQLNKLDEITLNFKINQIIYDLYGLTSEEITIVENSLKE